jgi:parallel beta-helix repeat protein
MKLALGAILLVFSFFVSTAQGAASRDADFSLAPSGDDNNPGTAEKPFASPARARQAVREKIAAGLKQPVKVIIRGGTYVLSETLSFGPEDSGTSEFPVIYAGYPGETPVFSGGRRITGWEKADNGRWKARTDVKNFRQLYVNGVRAVRARGEAPAGLELFGFRGYRTTAIGMADWPDAAELEFVYFTQWCQDYCKVKSISRDGQFAVIEMLQPYFTWGRRNEGKKVTDKLEKFYIENAIELLDEPGEWYLDQAAKTVYYIPRPGEDLASAEVIVPALEKIAELRGSLDAPVHDIHFVGLSFSYGSWLEPSEKGLVVIQANFTIDPLTLMERDGALAGVHNEYIKSPANVICHTAGKIKFEKCTFTHLGGAGLDFDSGSQDNQILGCSFTDISSSAIQIGAVLKEDHHPSDPRFVMKNNLVKNCLIENCAVDYGGGVGIFVGYTEGTVLANNEIRNLPYSGISMGWGWGEEDVGGGAENYYQPFKYDTPTTAKNNRIEYNHIHHVLLQLWDGAGIYTLGNQPGSMIRGNYIHDNVGMPGGIYLDEGSGFIEVSGNLIENVDSPLFKNNGAQNRTATCVFKDNWTDKKTVDKKGPDAKQIEDLIGKAGIQ